MLISGKKVTLENMENINQLKPLNHPYFKCISLGEKYVLWHENKRLFDNMLILKVGGISYNVLYIKEDERNENFYEQDFKHQIIPEYFFALTAILMECADIVVTNQMYATVIADGLDKKVFFISDKYVKKQNVEKLKYLTKVHQLVGWGDIENNIQRFIERIKPQIQPSTNVVEKKFLNVNPISDADITSDYFILKELKNIVKIVFITDENYAAMTAVAIQSAIENKKESSIYQICIVGYNLKNSTRQNFAKQETTGVEIYIISICDLKKFENIKQTRYITPTALLKFDLPAIFAADDKILYLDCDVFVQGDLTGFYHTDLKKCYAAVVKDAYYLLKPEIRAKHSLCSNNNYFNTGVMLLNLQKMREDNISEKLLNWRKNNDCYFMDQDAFNAVLSENVKEMSCLFNFLAFYPQVFSRKNIEDFYNISLPDNVIKLYKKSLILHYPGKIKPYMKNMGYLTENFMHYLSKTDFVGHY